MNKIKLIKGYERDNVGLSDKEMVEKFYEYLQEKIKLTPKDSFSIVYFLQEHLSVFSDTIEQCYNCKGLIDTDSEGLYWETKHRHYCNGCEYLVPNNYDRGKK